MDPLKLLLNTLGISVEHLVEGLKKCVNELGPEASEAVKKLLVTIGCGLICQWGELSHLNAPPPHTPTHPVLTCGHVFPWMYSYKVCMPRNLKEGAASTFLEGIFE
nr:secretoglobin family 3A member 2 [Mirounga angustirostris]